MPKFPKKEHWNTGLAQDYGISSVFANGMQILGHTLYMTS